MPLSQPNIVTRRRFPRVETRLSLEVRAECDLLFNTMTVNISQTGLSFETDRNTFKQLTVNQRVSEKSQPVEVDIKITLPKEDGSSIDICTHCRLFQLRRISRDCYHIGLEYAKLSESDDQELTRYIERITAGGRNWQRCQTHNIPAMQNKH